MANSRYAYVRQSELPDSLLPSTHLLIRLDGKGFHGFSTKYNFIKPNDCNALNLMNDSAKRVMEGTELQGEIVLAIGESDEFSFLLRRTASLHGRRASKLVSLVTSLFTAAYIFRWPHYFPNTPLEFTDLPVFDGRIVQYTTDFEVKDYFRWRQVDTHINNMYNTCFWSLVQLGGMTTKEANKELSGTISSQKQELLYSKFSINYNELPPIFRKGSILLWQTEEPESIEESTSELKIEESSKKLNKKKSKPKRNVVVVHEDLIQEQFWETGIGKDVLSG